MGNIWRSTIREIHLHTVCDAPGKTTGLLSWSLFHLDGRLLEAGRESVSGIRAVASAENARPLTKAEDLWRGQYHSANQIGNRAWAVSEDTVFFTCSRLSTSRVLPSHHRRTDQPTRISARFSIARLSTRVQVDLLVSRTSWMTTSSISIREKCAKSACAQKNSHPCRDQANVEAALTGGHGRIAARRRT